MTLPFQKHSPPDDSPTSAPPEGVVIGRKGALRTGHSSRYPQGGMSGGTSLQREGFETRKGTSPEEEDILFGALDNPSDNDSF